MLVEISDVLAANSSDGMSRPLSGSKEDALLFTTQEVETGTFRPGSNLSSALYIRLGFAATLAVAFTVFVAIRLRGRATPSRRAIGR
jgi:hypothetical protein